MKQDTGHGEHKSDSKNHRATGKNSAHGKNGRNDRHERSANPTRHSSRTSGNHDKDIRIVYEDQWLIVIEKPSGLLTMSAGRKGEDTAYSILTDYVRESKPMGRRAGSQRMRWDTWSDGRRRMERPRIFIVHRIDRNTSGLLVFAKDQQTKDALQENWSETVTARRYVAVVEGCQRNSEGTVTSWLMEDPRTLKMYSSPRDNGGQKAVTHYRVLEEFNETGYSLVEFELETGRKNQIRVHCADMGCPVAGDGKYGAASNPIGRLALHARTLEFIHPWTGKLMSFTTPIPRTFKSRKIKSGQ